jgi:gas vesicle protein
LKLEENQTMRVGWKNSLVAATIVCLLAGSPAGAQQGVKDNAKFFSADAVAKAEKQLDEIKSRFGTAVTIETLRFPDAERDRIKGMSEKDKGVFFKGLADKRMKELSLSSKDVLILISASPGWVQVKVGDEALASTMKGDIGARLQKRIQTELVAKRRDESVAQAVEMLSQHFATTGATKPSMGDRAKSAFDQVKKESTKAVSTVSKGAKDVVSNVKEGASKVSKEVKEDFAKTKEAVQGWNSSTMWVVGIVGVLVLFFALKGFFGGGKKVIVQQVPMPTNQYPQSQQGYAGGMQRPNPPQRPMYPPPGQGMGQPLNYGNQPPPPQQQGGGGGFMKGVVGGMLGGAAGAYIYDQMTRGGMGGQAHAGTPPNPTGAQAGDGNYGGGGDFGEDAPITSSGGDYGGGGDFGDDAGGDYGGGGDFGDDAGGDYGGGGDFGGDDAGGDFGGGGDFDDD